MVGLAFLIDGKPVALIHAIHELAEPTLWLGLGNTNQPREDALAEAEVWANSIGRK